MDHFGIGQAVQAVARVYFQSSRCSGRTTSLIESLKDQDRVYFADKREADRVKRLCKEREIDVECVVVDPKNPGSVFERGSSRGRAMFDHGWLEEYYLSMLEDCCKGIDHLERQTSGYGEEHRETRRQALEISKWNL